MPSKLPLDPFGRSRMPAQSSRKARVALLGRVAQDLLAGRLPDKEASLYVGGAISACLENGGDLARDYLQITKPKSHVTPSVLWRQIKEESAHFDEDKDQ